MSDWDDDDAYGDDFEDVIIHYRNLDVLSISYFRLRKHCLCIFNKSINTDSRLFSMHRFVIFYYRRHEEIKAHACFLALDLLLCQHKGH